MITKVIRDSSGKIINIGDWDYVLVDGQPTNPFPGGAYEDQADIVEGWDGGLYASDDPRRLSR